MAAVAIAILFLWGVSAAANFAHALQLAGNSEWALIIASASAGSDVVKAGAAFMVIAAWRRSLWLPFAAALLIWGATATWSVRSCFGFISETLLQSEVMRTTSADAYDDLRETYNNEKSYLKTLQGTTVSTKSARLSLKKEIEQQREVVDAARERWVSKKAAPRADGVSDALADDLPWLTPAVTRKITAVLFLALLELVSMLGFLGFSAFAKAPSPETPKEDEPKPAERATVDAEPKFTLLKTSQPIEKPKPTVNPLKQMPSQAKGDAKLYVFPTKSGERVIERATVRAFVEDLTKKHGPGSRIVTADVQHEFTVFAGGGVDPSLLGRWLSEFGINRTVRKDSRGRRYYELPKQLVA